MNSQQQNKYVLYREWLLIVAITLTLLSFFVFGDITKPLGNVLYDHLMRLQGFKSTSDIVIIAVDDRALANLGGWPLKRENYTHLLAALDEDHYHPKAIGFDFLFLDPTPYDADLAAQMLKFNTVLPLEFSFKDDANQTLAPSMPVKELANAAKLGHVNLSFDSDGVIRGINLAEQNWIQFSLMLYQQSKLDRPIQPSQHSQRRFRMVDPQVGFPTVSLADAIEDKYTRSLLKDKYVLVGVTAPSLGDRYPTLYSGKNNASTPGVAILASILNASINQALIEESTPLVLFFFSLLPLFVMLLSLLRLQPRHALLLVGLLILGSISISYEQLSLSNYWIDPTPFIIVSVIAQPLWAWRRLEAMLSVVGNKAAELQKILTSDNPLTITKPASEAVLEYAKVLDVAVASVHSELKFLSAVIDEIPDAVAIFDPHDQLLLVNQKIKELIDLNYLKKGIKLTEIADQLQIPLSLLSDQADELKKSTNQLMVQLSTLLGKKYFLIKTTRISSPTGGQLRLVVLTDFTELRQSQTQRDRALQFLSHDMRTPIASILSLTRSAEERTQSESKIEKIIHHANTLLSMIDDFILNISAEADQYEFQEELLDNLINDALEQVSDLAKAKGISLLDVSDFSAVFVMTNNRLFVRALVNLLFNSIKFSPVNSDIHIKVLHADPTAECVEHACIYITNKIETRNRFDQFSTSMPGFGIGLVFVDTVIQKHRATITRNIPSSGIASVCIKIPCSK